MAGGGPAWLAADAADVMATTSRQDSSFGRDKYYSHSVSIGGPVAQALNDSKAREGSIRRGCGEIIVVVVVVVDDDLTQVMPGRAVGGGGAVIIKAAVSTKL
jgi:hypothetical protein